MPFCSKCGNSVTQEMAFCPACGNSLTAQVVPAAVEQPAAAQTTEAADYKVVLMNAGGGSSSQAIRVLEDVMGCTSAQARDLLHAVPVEIGCGLTLAQATCIVQVLDEYGMSAGVFDAQDNCIKIELGDPAAVFDDQGDFLPAVAAALDVISAANRAFRISGRRRPGGLFAGLFAPPPPKPHRPKPRPPAPPKPRAPKPPAPPKPRAPKPPAPPRPKSPGGRGPAGGFGGGSRGGGFGRR